MPVDEAGAVAETKGRVAQALGPGHVQRLVDRSGEPLVLGFQARDLVAKAVQERKAGHRLDRVRLFRDLYAVLSDDQKKDADEMVIPMVGMMGGPGS